MKRGFVFISRVVVMLCMMRFVVTVASVRGASPRRFTFLKKLRFRPNLKRIRHIRTVPRCVVMSVCALCLSFCPEHIDDMVIFIH